MTIRSFPAKQGGAALVIGLILLVVVTVLAISGMNTATTELALARNDQNHEYAFQAAETGLEQALASSPFNPLADVNFTTDVNDHDTVATTIQFAVSTMVPPSANKAYSIGVGSGISAYHFAATAQASSRRIAGGGDTDRDASAVHTQAFYVIGPESPTL
jgi:type IV pilus assembly protein PilX